jgi:uncharacterized repeat protein (TIGR03803 family)
LIGLVAVIVVMSVVVLNGEELKHLPPAAPSFMVLHSFAGPPTDGEAPNAGLILDTAGNLYGTTVSGGAASTCVAAYLCGVVFELSPAGAETLLHSFTGGADGGDPYGALVRDGAGNLYGTTELGGAYGYGVVFELIRCDSEPSGYEFKVRYSFKGGADGAYPLAGLIRDAKDNLYGTTTYGGASGQGVVFKLSPSGAETILYTFTGGADGADPHSALLRDAAGNLYGTTAYGGGSSACESGCGTVFKVSPAGTETILYRFSGGADGAFPNAALIQDPALNLYSTTAYGGASGQGVVFKLSPSGAETILYTFAGGADGANPYGGLLQDAAGNLYGTTTFGGAESSACPLGCGTVFKLSPSRTEIVLHSFTRADGAEPYGALVRDGAGHLYGTTYSGGTSGTGVGVVFRLTP